MDITGGRRTEPHIAQFCSWAALLAAFVLSWTTWVGVGDIAEYGVYRYALPVCVDGYIVTVLMAWIAPRDSKAARFARWNVYLSAGLSILTQSVYHGALVYSHTVTPWKALIAWLAGALPPLFAALSVHFRTGVRVTESQTAPTPAMPAGVTQPLPPLSAPAVTPMAPAPYPVVSRETSPSAPVTAPPAGSPVPRAVPLSPPTSPVPAGPPARPAAPAAVPAQSTTLSRPQVARRVPVPKTAQARRDAAWRIFDDEARTGHRTPRSQIAQRVGVTERQVKYYLAAWRQARGEQEGRSA